MSRDLKCLVLNTSVKVDGLLFSSLEGDNVIWTFGRKLYFFFLLALQPHDHSRRAAV